jgi:hypothetical protein
MLMGHGVYKTSGKEKGFPRHKETFGLGTKSKNIWTLGLHGSFQKRLNTVG